MKLNDAQLESLRVWAASGIGLSGIQKNLEEKLGITMTYMDVRFLLDDYSINLEDPKPAKPAEAPKAAEEPQVQDVPEEAVETEVAGGAVVVDMDKLSRPGALASGSVTFSDGVKGKWYLDQTGRLGLEGIEKSYRPSPDDISDFQMELQRLLQQKGY
jgi:hypothetical protein